MGKVLYMRKGDIHTIPGSRLPFGYTELAYIQGDGKAYINTEVSGVFPVSASLKMRTGSGTNSADMVMLGAYQSNAMSTLVYYYANRWYMSVGGQTLSATSTSVSDNTDYEIEASMSSGSQSFKANGTVMITGSVSASAADIPLYLFARNDSGTATRISTGRIYYCQIYKGGALVRYFLPCINSSGKVGLYDIVGKRFYGNAGSGTFIGSEVA